MNEILVSMLQYMVSYVGIIAILFFGLNFFTKGFILKYLKVRMSQGRLTLSRIHAVTDTYYVTGKWRKCIS